MTIDEAINHCLEVAEQNETSAITYKNCKEIKANMYEKLTAEKAENDCRECAADHRQLAEWLRELKELREENKVLMSECDRLIKEKGELLKKTADVQPAKHGRWIEQRHSPTNGYNYNVPYSTYVCSSCGLEIHNDEYSKYVRGTHTNCPICTARMDGEDNE